ncbi:MAG: cysteine desulfurase family protein [Planctomycetota bacterium]|nr:cysteine desulfurase family protein [Planctomycetota bacterium]
MLYFDNNATTRPSHGVVAAMCRAMEEHWANPSSLHRHGQIARAQVELARKQLAQLVGAQARDLVFTGSGTESIDLAIRGVLAAWPQERGRPVIVTSRLEHAAIRELALDLESCGLAEVRWIPIHCTRSGCMNAQDVEPLLDERTAIVSVQWANNETGAIHPVGEIASLCRARGIAFHCDGTQWVGKLHTSVIATGPNNVAAAPKPLGAGGLKSQPTPWLDLLTFAPHKFYGPKGIGVLWIRRGLRIKPCIHGSQELGRRGGTENVPGIIGAGVAAAEAIDWLADPANIERVRSLRDRFEQGVCAAIPDAVVNGPQDLSLRVWNTTNIGFPRLESEALLIMLSERGLCASAGSACSSGSLEPSPVLRAMGVPEEVAFGSLRFSLSRDTTQEEVDRGIALVVDCVERLRASCAAVV